MQDSDRSAHEPALVSTRTMDIVVALLFLLASALVLYGSYEVGIGWVEGVGPASGYFPFYIGLIMAGASAINLVRALFHLEAGGDSIFVSRPAFGRVVAVAVPTLIYVALVGGVSFGRVAIPGIGIYLASAVFTLAFMLAVGRESLLRSIVVAVVTPIFLFVMFEKEFLIPLPKCAFGFCEGIEERLIGAPYDVLREHLVALLTALWRGLRTLWQTVVG